MATYTSIFVPESSGAANTSDLNGTVGNGAASGEIVLGKNRTFAINASGDVNIIFGNSGVKTPTAANFRIPSGVIATYDTGDSSDRIRLFNNGAGSITYWIQFLTRT